MTQKPNAALLKYVNHVARMGLGEGMPEVELREHGDMTVSYYSGLPLAAYWIEGEEIVFRFPRPDDDSKREGVERYYRVLSTPKGWLEYRRPLSRDPKPNLVAKLADVKGTSFFEISKGGRVLAPVSVEEIRTPHEGASSTHVDAIASITSAGGPYIALPESLLTKYPGFEDDALNETVFRAAREEGSVADLPFGRALLLGTPDTLYWFPDANGGHLVRVSSFDADDDELLAKKISELGDAEWNAIEGTLDVKGPWWVFDSALPGSEAKTAGLGLALTKGTYEVSSRTVTGDDHEFAIVRLRRVSAQKATTRARKK